MYDKNMKIHFGYIRFVAPVYWFKGIFLCLFIICVYCLIPVTTYADGQLSAYRKGLAYMENGSPAEAVPVFSELLDKGSPISDYLLLWRAQARFKNGELEKAQEDINALLHEHQDSPVIREARKMNIVISMLTGSDTAGSTQELFEEFTDLYPGDSTMRFEFVQFLRSSGNEARALEVMTGLYREGFDFPDERYVPDDGQLVLDDMLQRGDALYGLWRFREAEDIYKRTLTRAQGEAVEEIKEKIALCVFRQKRYAVSAGLFAELNDRYLEAVSYLRAGNGDRFLEVLDELKKTRDPRTGALLLVLAAEKRNDGNSDEAMALYRTVATQYPFREDAQWGIGWTEFLSGNFTGSKDIFKELYEKYDSDKYLYWRIRSEEKMSSFAPEEYEQLCSRGGYYGLLGCIRSRIDMHRITFPDEYADDLDQSLFGRYNILKVLDLKDEALYELKRITNGTNGRNEIMLLSRKLRDLGEYKSAISVATRLPYEEEIHGLLYPVAYIDVIRSVSDRFGLNPLYVLSVAREESRLDPEARSIAGAVGLMQIMPQTADLVSRSLHYPVAAESGFYDVETNILLGSYYLKTLLERFDSVILATAAYNAGGGAVERWLSQFPTDSSDEFVEEIPFQETRNYVKKVLATFYQYVKASSSGKLDNNILMKTRLPISKMSSARVF